VSAEQHYTLMRCPKNQTSVEQSLYRYYWDLSEQETRRRIVQEILEFEMTSNRSESVIVHILHSCYVPLQGTPSFQDFADWTQSKKQLKSQCLSCSSKDRAHNC
jgi:hypothetical protein